VVFKARHTVGFVDDYCHHYVMIRFSPDVRNFESSSSSGFRDLKLLGKSLPAIASGVDCPMPNFTSFLQHFAGLVDC